VEIEAPTWHTVSSTEATAYGKGNDSLHLGTGDHRVNSVEDCVTDRIVILPYMCMPN
jgi:hypothetical protein